MTYRDFEKVFADITTWRFEKKDEEGELYNKLIHLMLAVGLGIEEKVQHVSVDGGPTVEKTYYAITFPSSYAPTPYESVLAFMMSDMGKEYIKNAHHTPFELAKHTGFEDE